MYTYVVQVTPRRRRLEVRTVRRPHKVGVMLVGWGGNNGTTLTAALLANRMGTEWATKEGVRKADWFGSLTQSSTMRLGVDEGGREVWTPLHALVPMVKPDDLEVDGWDISGLNLEEAARRNRVLEVELQRILGPHLRALRPRAAAFDSDFVAANQRERADNILQGTRSEQVQRLRADIRDFKKSKALDQVVVVWTANTERFCELRDGLNDTADNLLQAIERDEKEISSSTLYAVASILEGVSMNNLCILQNTRDDA
jgi:myo-inositol-1-phosphate synthase